MIRRKSNHGYVLSKELIAIEFRLIECDWIMQTYVLRKNRGVIQNSLKPQRS